MRSNVKSKQSSITFQSQLRVTLCSHTVFTSHDVRVNKLRLSCHPNSFKGVHNLFIRNAVSFSPPTFASALLALVRLTGTRVPWNPRANPPPPPPPPRSCCNIHLSYNRHSVNFLRETDFEKLSLAASNLSIRNLKYHFKSKYMEVNSEFQ